MTTTAKAVDQELRAMMPKIKGMVWYYFRNELEHQREDALQDLLVKLWRNWHALSKEPRKLYSWISVTARALSVDYFRQWAKEKRYIQHGFTLDSAAAVLEGHGEYSAPCPASAILRAYEPDPYLLPALRAFLGELPERHRTVLEMAADGYSYQEIAEIAGTSAGTVRSRLHYARKKAVERLAAFR